MQVDYVDRTHVKNKTIKNLKERPIICHRGEEHICVRKSKIAPLSQIFAQLGHCYKQKDQVDTQFSS